MFRAPGKDAVFIGTIGACSDVIESSGSSAQNCNGSIPRSVVCTTMSNVQPAGTSLDFSAIRQYLSQSLSASSAASIHLVLARHDGITDSPKLDNVDLYDCCKTYPSPMVAVSQSPMQAYLPTWELLKTIAGHRSIMRNLLNYKCRRRRVRLQPILMTPTVSPMA